MPINNNSESDLIISIIKYTKDRKKFKLFFENSALGWVAKLVARLPATAALWFRDQTSLKEHSIPIKKLSNYYKIADPNDPEWPRSRTKIVCSSSVRYCKNPDSI
jgi:hypothetical protein